jgi:hypothetical protein
MPRTHHPRTTRRVTSQSGTERTSRVIRLGKDVPAPGALRPRRELQDVAARQARWRKSPTGHGLVSVMTVGQCLAPRGADTRPRASQGWPGVDER